MPLAALALEAPQAVDWRKAAGEWMTFILLLFQFEMGCAVIHSPPSSRDVAVAVLFVLLEGAVSLNWCCTRGPLGNVSGGSVARVSRLAKLICQKTVLREMAHIPPHSCDPMLMLHEKAREDIEERAQRLTLQIWSGIQANAGSISASQVVGTIPRPALMEPAKAPPASAAPAVAATKCAKVLMLQYKALQADAAQPPAINGIETAGLMFSRIRHIILDVLASIGWTTPRAVAICVWGDVTMHTELCNMEGIVPGGKYWKQRERKLRADFSWVYEPEASNPLYYHDRYNEPLFVFHVADVRWTLNLDLAKGSNFLKLFPVGSPERVLLNTSNPLQISARLTLYQFGPALQIRTAKWEAAVAAGTIDAFLNVQLDHDFTLRTALQYGMTGCESRHGVMHVKWFTHALSMCAASSLQPDGRWRPRRCAMGEPHSPKAALFTMVRDFVPFASRIYYATVQGAELLEAHVLGRIDPDYPFSYWSLTMYSDAHVVKDVPGLKQWCNTSHGDQHKEGNFHDNGDGKGMDLHRDRHSGYTIVLVIGALIEGFKQLYPTCGVGIPLACWAWTSSNSRELLHAVSRGRGLRIGLLYTVHTSMASGATSTGREVAWDLGVVEAPPKGPMECAP